MSEAVFALMILAMVIGGLLMMEAMCVYDDKRRYRRWVNDREQILRNLENENDSNSEEDSSNV